ncbi:MAG TPA: M24 family metallopeptidase [Acidimicrobiia bacterium]|nr:M24 family metallopeptidase [Acidimicrobiia bacterium]
MTPPPLSLRLRAERYDLSLRQRLDNVVPKLMDRHGIDAWVLVAREYNEDPVVQTMLPATWLSARRRTILVFTAHGRQRHAVARYGVDELFPRAWDPDRQPDQWACVAELLAAADPAHIAVSTSETFALGDGLSHSEHEQLVAALDPRLRSRTVSGEALAVGWLETRIDTEVADLRHACALAHDIIATGLSNEAITPGSTTTTDLEWWFRESAAASNLAAWFQPTVSVQRSGGTGRSGFAEHPGDTIIEPGDLVHVDFGIEYIGMHTDQQQHAYVLRSDETEPPAGLATGLREGNLAQDLLTAQFATGRTGNEVLRDALAETRAAGIDATIYTHAVGKHGHAAGPTIGLWDQQEGVPGAGDYPVHPDTAYSIELSVVWNVAEWEGQPIRVMLEEDAFFDGHTMRYLDGRQTELHVVG